MRHRPTEAATQVHEAQVRPIRQQVLQLLPGILASVVERHAGEQAAAEHQGQPEEQQEVDPTGDWYAPQGSHQEGQGRLHEPPAWAEVQPAGEEHRQHRLEQHPNQGREAQAQSHQDHQRRKRQGLRQEGAEDRRQAAEQGHAPILDG